MPTDQNTQRVIQKVRSAMKKDAAPESLADDLVRFVAARCAQIVSETEPPEAAHGAIRTEFGL